MTRPTIAAVLAVSVALGLAACGGDDEQKTTTTTAPAASEQAAILATAKKFTGAFLDGDYATACALMTANARDQMTAAAQAAKLGSGDCPSILKAASGAVDANMRAQLDNLKLTIVKVTGDTAVVRTSISGQFDTTSLRKVNGTWQVDANL